MRHLLLAAAMLVVALVVTLGTANVLQDVAVARNSLQGDPFEVTEIAAPAMKLVTAKERVKSFSHN
jgi:hypothetical protein